MCRWHRPLTTLQSCRARKFLYLVIRDEIVLIIIAVML